MGIRQRAGIRRCKGIRQCAGIRQRAQMRQLANIAGERMKSIARTSAAERSMSGNQNAMPAKTQPPALVRYEAMCKAIAECHRVDEVKETKGNLNELTQRYPPEHAACNSRTGSQRQLLHFAWPVALKVYDLYSGELEEPHISYACYEHYKQMARQLLAEKTTHCLQDRYPVKIQGISNYKPLAELTEQELLWNYERLRKAADAMTQHATTLLIYIKVKFSRRRAANDSCGEIRV